MARGYAYEVTEKIEDVRSMTETDFYDQCGKLADFFSDVPEYEAEELVSSLVERFGICGFETGKDSDVNGKETFWVIPTQEGREKYFLARFNSLKEYVSKMSLKEFSESSFKLQELIDNDYTDGIYINEMFDTMDHFVRNCICGTKYYFGNVVLMH